MVQCLEMKTALRYPVKSNDRRIDQANVPSTEHPSHGKWRFVETFPEEHSLMPLLCRLLLHLIKTILMGNRSYDDVTGSHKWRGFATAHMSQ